MRHCSKMVAVVILLAFGAATSESAMAQHHGGVRFGINIGIPLFGQGYYLAILGKDCRDRPSSWPH